MITSEQIYELNLPSLSEITLSTFKGFNDDHLMFNYLRLDTIDNIIKPEYRNIQGLNWCKMSYFKKTNLKGAIHSDAMNSGEHLFGINWITGGHCVMEYWDYDEVEEFGSTAGALNKPNWGVVDKYKPIRNPSKRYVLRENKAYLVNATTLHRAIGLGPRKCYSLRIAECNIPWNNIVQLFNPLIVTKNDTKKTTYSYQLTP